MRSSKISPTTSGRPIPLAPPPCTLGVVGGRAHNTALNFRYLCIVWRYSENGRCVNPNLVTERPTCIISVSHTDTPGTDDLNPAPARLRPLLSTPYLVSGCLDLSIRGNLQMTPLLVPFDLKSSSVQFHSPGCLSSFLTLAVVNSLVAAPG